MKHDTWMLAENAENLSSDEKHRQASASCGQMEAVLLLNVSRCDENRPIRAQTRAQHWFRVGSGPN
jgi:hypothetical protein